MREKVTALTPAELGKLWATYVGNTMGSWVLRYYLKHVKDPDIKSLLSHALKLSDSFIEILHSLFKKEKFPVPVGFTEDDVDLNAPRLYYDEFYPHYLEYLAKAGISIYSVAIPLVSRKDIEELFAHCISETTKLILHSKSVLKKHNLLDNPPAISYPDEVEFVQDTSFLNGYFGDVRQLHGLEVAHLYGNIHNDRTSRALMLGFVQGAKQESVKAFLNRGIDLNQKHITKMSKKLIDAHLPAPPNIDHLVCSSNATPFSEKLMIFHKIDMFSMKIREYANGASLNGRRDIGALYMKCQIDVSLYVEDGAQLLIKNGWMEQPPLLK